MYKKLLLGLLATISLVPLPTTKSWASNIENNKHRTLECAVDNFSRSKNNEITTINFHEHLTFSTIGSRINVKFSPHNLQKQPLALASLAAKLGYQSFNWVSYVEQDPYGMIDYRGNLLSLPYNDPPLGGYEYGAADNYPFYWDIEQCENCHSRYNYRHPKVKQKYALYFEDSPADYRLKEGETVEFITHLVGVVDRNSEYNRSSWEVLTTFKWQLTNDAEGRGQVSLIAVNLLTSELSPSVLASIQKDGGFIPQSTAIANLSKDNFHNHQCQLQSHQNQHLGSHL